MTKTSIYQSVMVAVLLVACAGCCSLFQPSGGDSPVTPGHAGHFDSDIATVNLLSDGRSAVLLKSLTYTDVRGIKWTAQAGERSDGASIPQVFWSIVGGPWEGKYRFAALVHDHYCDSHDGRKWQDVHRMFYEACIAGGTDPLLAKIVYAAVYHFGPRWSDESKGYEQLALLIPLEEKRIADARETEALKGIPTTNTFGALREPLKLAQHEQALLVLSPTPAIRTFAVPQFSSTVSKWDRIRSYLLNHQDASLDEIDRIP